MKLSEALEHYRSHVSILKKGYQQERYRIDQISRSFLGAMAVDAVTSVNIATYRDKRLTEVNPRTKKPLSASTVRLELSLLSNMYDLSRIEWGFAESNPVKNVRKPKAPPGRDRRLTPREERLILRYCHNHKNPELYSIVIVALETAMRQGEILKLRWENINLLSRIAHLPDTKNGTSRDVPLTLKAREVLIRLGVRSQGSVFRYSSPGIKSTWRVMMETLQIENLHFHDLRHEAISRLTELGSLSVLEIAAISGHKSLSMLKRYSHLSTNRLVRKLEAPRNKANRAVLEHLIPYPAVVDTYADHVTVRFMDFETPPLEVQSTTMGLALHDAKNALLRRILIGLKTAVPLPKPDQYLEDISELEIVMIDPLDVACSV